MFHRLCKLSTNKSFFIFGPRATGKSTLLKEFAAPLGESCLWIDLLDPETERDLSVHPSRLVERLVRKGQKLYAWVVIDEVQKIPKLLDVVHKMIFEHDIHFALTGSSARKLRRGEANMLAGRAFSYRLHPLSFVETPEVFDVQETLSWGSLPEIYKLESESDKKRYLHSYVQNYIQQEILVEQVIRNIEPFRAFLEVAAQANAEIINHAKLAREAGIDPKSVERYFEILEDTLLGFLLRPYSKSVRKRQSQKPKFYFFDTGVSRTLANVLDSKPVKGTYGYGRNFEHMVILEAIRLNDYYEAGYRMSYLRTKDGVEVDLVLEKNRQTILVEIKSKDHVTEDDLSSLRSLGRDISDSRKIVLCQETSPRFIGDIEIWPWQEGVRLLMA